MSKRLSTWMTALALVGAAFVARPALAADTYDVDTEHTFAVFRIGHLGAGHVWGFIRKTTGTIVFDDANPANNHIKLELDARSVYTGVKKRDGHLRSPDFFNTKQFPTWTFESTSWRKTGENTYEVEGKLTIRGVTKPIRATVRKTGEGPDPWGNYRIGFSTKLTLHRLDFGVKFMPKAIPNEVEVFFDIEGIKKK